MGLSKTQIYNNALLKVSKKQIDTPEDGTFEANTCNALWDMAIERTLACHNWSSTIKNVALDSTLDTPNMFSYSFRLPNDCVKILKAYNSTDRDYFDFEWVTQEREFLTNESTVYIDYIAKPTTTEFLNAHITDVIIWNLAMALSFPFTGEDGRERVLREEFERIVLPRAKAGDAMESREIQYEESPWIESLYGSNPAIGVA